MNEIKYAPIGVIRSPFKKPEGTPIQTRAAEGIDGTIELLPKYAEGLKDIEGFSHLILIYHFHFSKKLSLKVKPFLDDKIHGVFATRAPSRPNPIGISVVRLVSVKGNTLHIRDVDIVDKTPLLDIKPYIPEFDIKSVDKIGWLKNNVDKLNNTKDDGRFIE